MVPSPSCTGSSSPEVELPYYHGKDLSKSRYQLNLNAQEVPVRADQDSLLMAGNSECGPSIVY